MAARPAPNVIKREELTPSELTNIPRLLEHGLCVYSNPATCPFPEHRARIDELSQVFDGSDLWQARIMGTGSDLAKRRSNTFDVAPDFVRAVQGLTEELLFAQGDDVISGTVFAPPSSFDGANNAAAAAASSSQNKNANLPPKFWFSVNGHDVRVPIDEQTAYLLYCNGTQSEFSQEVTHQDGTTSVENFYDPKMRKSVELSRRHLELPPFLQDPRAHFPEIDKHIKHRLTNDAAEIAIVPDKLVVYSVGDKFGWHRDTIRDDPRHIGTVVIHLPCEGDYQDDESTLEPTDRFSYSRNDHSASDSEVEIDGDEDVATTEVIQEDDDATAAIPPTALSKRSRGGGLRFLLGRASSGQAEDGVVTNALWSTYGLPKTGETQLCAIVRLQNYTRAEVFDGVPDPLGSANRLAACEPKLLYRDAQQQNNNTVAPGAAAAAASSSKPTAAACTSSSSPTTAKQHRVRKHIPLHWCAWMTDTLHSVKKLKSGYRVVITYRLLRRGATEPRISRWNTLLSQVERIMRVVTQTFNRFNSLIGKTKPDKIVVTPELKQLRSLPRAFGIICRHLYPVGSISPGILKGVDAAAYKVLAWHCDVVVVPVATVHEGYQSCAFDIYESADGLTSAKQQQQSATNPSNGMAQLPQQVFVSTNPVFAGADLSREHCEDQLSGHGFPQIIDTWFVRLAVGEIASAGRSYGNADCGAQWCARTTAIIALPGDGKWRRRRVLFLAADKTTAPQGNLIQKISNVYGIFRNIAYFL